MDKLDFIKIKNFCMLKDTITKMKWQTQVIEIFEKYLQNTYLTKVLHPVYRKNSNDL